MKSVQEALDRLHARSANDPDLIAILDGLVEVVTELSKYKWVETRMSADEQAALLRGAGDGH
jgi:hypothetical protein